MRLQFCAHASSPSGAQNCLELLLAGFDPLRISSFVTVPGPGGVFAKLSSMGYAVDQAPLQWWISIDPDLQRQARRCASGLLERVDRLSRIFERNRPSIVITNTSVILEPAIAAARLGIPHIWHVLEALGKDPDLHPSMGINLSGEIIAALSDRVVAVSKLVADSLSTCGVPDSLISVVHTGIDIEQISSVQPTHRKSLGLTDTDVVFAYAGYLSKRKGVATLATAIPKVLTQIPNARFIFAGRNGGEESNVRKILKDGIKTGAVSMLGYRADALGILAMSDVVLMPSMIDPLPVTVLEAMALGKPVIATRSGGCEQMVDQGTTGLLVDPENPDQLADAMIQLAQSADTRTAFGTQGRIRVRELFDLRQRASDFISQVERATQANPTRDRRLIAELLLNHEKVLPKSLFAAAVNRFEDSALHRWRRLRHETQRVREAILSPRKRC